MDVLNHIKKKFDIPEKSKSPYRLKKFVRDDMYDLFNDLGLKRGAEIGVYRGENALSICKRIPGLKFMAVDFYKAYGHKRNEKNQPIFLKIAKRRLRKYLEEGNVEFVLKSSMEVVKDVEDESLDFVYIDADHSFDFVMQDIIEWTKKVRHGGIVSGHDYGITAIRVAVKTYTRMHKVTDWFVIGEGKKSSWFWVRP